MDTKKAILLKILLNRYGKGSPQIALKALPEDIIKQVSQVSISAADPKPLFEYSQATLHKIHYSWIMPSLKKMPQETYASIISCLSKYQQSRLRDLLNVKEAHEAPLSIASSYILNTFYRKIKGIDEVLPLDYLPETPLTPLGKWEKKNLVELVEFLGIHDLSEDMRHIVDKKILKNAYNSLSPKEQKYLKICMHLKEKVSSPALGLDKWNGDKDKLKAVLQTRGLIRLGKAISGLSPDFIWHLSHIFDTGRGQALMKYYTKAAVPGITAALSQQVVNIMNFLKTKE